MRVFLVLACFALFSSHAFADDPLPRPKSRSVNYTCPWVGHKPVFHYVDWDGDGYLDKEPIRLCPSDPANTAYVDWGEPVSPEWWNSDKYVVQKWYYPQPIPVDQVQGMNDFEFDCDGDNPNLQQWLPVLGVDSDNDGIPRKVLKKRICTTYLTPTKDLPSQLGWDRKGMAIDWPEMNRWKTAYSAYGPITLGYGLFKSTLYPDRTYTPGWRVAGGGQWAYVSGKGYDVEGAVDCNDSDATVPFAPVRLDTDGDGYPDPVDQIKFDKDGDGKLDDFDPAEARYLSCDAPILVGKRYVSLATVQSVDGILQRPVYRDSQMIDDCQAKTRGKFEPLQVYYDYDDDGYGNEYSGKFPVCVGSGMETNANNVPLHRSLRGGDCNDSDASVHVCSISFNQPGFEMDNYKNGAGAVVLEATTLAVGWKKLLNLKPYVVKSGVDDLDMNYSLACEDCAAFWVYRGTGVMEWDSSHLSGGFHTVTVRAYSPRANVEGKIDIKVFVVNSTTVAFLNGVNNSSDDADKSLAAAKIYADEIISNVMRPQSKPGNADQLMLYNSSATLPLDLFELFLQKIQELSDEMIEEADKQQSRRILFDGAESSNLEAMQRALSLGSLKVQQFAAKIFKAFIDFEREKLFATSRSSGGDANFKAKIEERIKTGSRIVLVSHSQGNQFSNEVYEGLSPLARLLTRQVQVAPTTNTSLDNYDSYLLNNRDVVKALTTRNPNTTVRDRCDSVLDEETVDKLNQLFHATNLVIAGGAGGLPQITNVDEFIESSTLYHGFRECYLDDQSQSLQDFRSIFESSLRSIQL